MRLSKQALASLMLLVQKSLMEQSDMVAALLDFDFDLDENQELFVKNPPTINFSEFLEKNEDLDELRHFKGE